jgi:hypothetical protein
MMMHELANPKWNLYLAKIQLRDQSQESVLPKFCVVSIRAVSKNEKHGLADGRNSDILLGKRMGELMTVKMAEMHEV